MVLYYFFCARWTISISEPSSSEFSVIHLSVCLSTNLHIFFFFTFFSRTIGNVVILFKNVHDWMELFMNILSYLQSKNTMISLFHNSGRWPGSFLLHDILTRFISLKQVKMTAIIGSFAAVNDFLNDLEDVSGCGSNCNVRRLNILPFWHPAQWNLIFCLTCKYIHLHVCLKISLSFIPSWSSDWEGGGQNGWFKDVKAVFPYIIRFWNKQLSVYEILNVMYQITKIKFKFLKILE